jgi:hypothetical protein
VPTWVLPLCVGYVSSAVKDLYCATDHILTLSVAERTKEKMKRLSLSFIVLFVLQFAAVSFAQRTIFLDSVLVGTVCQEILSDTSITLKVNLLPTTIFSLASVQQANIQYSVNLELFQWNGVASNAVFQLEEDDGLAGTDNLGIVNVTLASIQTTSTPFHTSVGCDGVNSTIWLRYVSTSSSAPPASTSIDTSSSVSTETPSSLGSKQK